MSNTEKNSCRTQLNTEVAYKLSISTYGYGGGLAIDLLQKEDESFVPYGNLTVNLSKACDVNAAYIDVNHNAGIMEALLEYHMGKPTGRVCQSGFCQYPEFLFDEEKLRQADEVGYLKYLDQCDRGHGGMSKIYGMCSHCHETSVFYVTDKQMEQYEAYLQGEGFIQDIFPDMEPGDRELLRGGSICKKCWKAMFGMPDQEEE